MRKLQGMAKRRLKMCGSHALKGHGFVAIAAVAKGSAMRARHVGQPLQARFPGSGAPGKTGKRTIIL